MAHFSLLHCIVPLTGLVGRSATLCLYLLRTLFAMAILPLPYALVYHLASTCGALYLGALETKTPTGLPNQVYVRGALATLVLACFALFLLHPVGSQASLYTIFWLIPLIPLALPSKKAVRPEELWPRRALHALGATFTTHAVGSVIWLYCVGTLTPQGWLALMPIVCLERLLFASGITIGISIYSIIQRLLYTMSCHAFCSRTLKRFLHV